MYEAFTAFAVIELPRRPAGPTPDTNDLRDRV
jgi:hypothetical protein